ncbi:MAG: hypothetical protein FD167_221 [bacterium]|nr:MAG: hypothetical protein FD167_221 [bacterium]
MSNYTNKGRRQIQEAANDQVRASIIRDNHKEIFEALPRQFDEMKQTIKGFKERLRGAHPTLTKSDEIIIPYAIPVDLQTSSRYFYAALACLVFIALLAAWFSDAWGISPIIAIAIELVIALFTDGLLLYIFNRADEPTASIRRIRQFVVIPSGIAILITLPLFLLTRFVTDELALLFLPIATFSMYGLTIAVTLAGAGLLVCSYILKWSQRDSKHFHGLVQAYASYKSFHEELHDLFEEFGYQTSSLRCEFAEDNRPVTVLVIEQLKIDLARNRSKKQLMLK